MKKVLIITYYWPPAGGPGVQRVLKFVKYLPKFDWEPIVMTVENGEFPSIDNSLLNDIPKNLKVYKTKTFEPFVLYKRLIGKKKDDRITTLALNKNENEKFIEKIFRWIRFNFFIPDARKGWKKYIVEEGLKIINIEKPDLIFSSSPPHSLQIGAEKLSKKSGLKWVSDFRDPWTEGFWLKNINRTFFANFCDKYFEQKVIKKSNGISLVSKDMVHLYNIDSDKKMINIPNGFDDEDFLKVDKEESSGKFNITYSGSLRESQIPVNLIKALGNLIKENKIDKNKIEINFWGNIHPGISILAEKYNISELINYNGYIAHDQLINQICVADILLLLIPDTENNKGILTGKLFEYLRTYNFILGIGPEDGEAADILNKTNAGKMLGFDKNPESLLVEMYNRWINKINNKPNTEAINDYSRKKLTEDLANFFDLIIK